MTAVTVSSSGARCAEKPTQQDFYLIATVDDDELLSAGGCGYTTSRHQAAPTGQRVAALRQGSCRHRWLAGAELPTPRAAAKEGLAALRHQLQQRKHTAFASQAHRCLDISRSRATCAQQIFDSWLQRMLRRKSCEIHLKTKEN